MIPVEIMGLQARLAARVGATRSELVSDHRGRKTICSLRTIGIYIARETRGYSHKELAEFFRRKNHATSITCCRRAPRLLNTDEWLREIYEAERNMMDKNAADSISVPAHELPLEILLDEAAQVLSDAGSHSLARGIQIANALLTGDPPVGESFIKDLLEVLELAENLQAEAVEDPSGVFSYSVDSEPMECLARAVERCRDWGLNPEERTRNALRKIIEALEIIRTTSTDPASKAKADETLASLGFATK